MKIGLEFLKQFKFSLSVNVMSNCQNNTELFWRSAFQKKVCKCQNDTDLTFVKIVYSKHLNIGFQKTRQNWQCFHCCQLLSTHGNLWQILVTDGGFWQLLTAYGNASMLQIFTYSSFRDASLFHFGWLFGKVPKGGRGPFPIQKF